MLMGGSRGRGSHEGQYQGQTRCPRKSGQGDGAEAQPPSNFSWTFPAPHSALLCYIEPTAYTHWRELFHS